MSSVTDSELPKRAGGRSNAYPNDMDNQAQALDHARKILDSMVEESACSICYEPLRSMHVTHCGHNHCTQCIRTLFAGTGVCRRVPRGRLDEYKVYAQCPTCHAEVGLDLDENDRLIVPVVVAAEKQLGRLREWSQRRRVQNDELLAQGASLDSTASSRRRLADAMAREDERRASATGASAFAYGNMFPARHPETSPTPWPTVPLPSPWGWAQNTERSIPTAGMASSSAEAPSQPWGYQPGFIPPSYHYPPPLGIRRTREDENLMSSADGEVVRAHAPHGLQ
ncbi:hypothetical protein LX32DRAFT_568819 [Colletotrichum zoysiae]|uniref:RING-type domain-containing protein n=1 Tax=Colletotrichum zoysiae TaxID=1216348 RepID=A0AAD9M0V5_9PEZI|nr:hypothetical protein LX32DRAFT_568819 [Colletotrichum zoysiae]